MRQAQNYAAAPQDRHGRLHHELASEEIAGPYIRPIGFGKLKLLKRPTSIGSTQGSPLAERARTVRGARELGPRDDGPCPGCARQPPIGGVESMLAEICVVRDQNAAGLKPTACINQLL